MFQGQANRFFFEQLTTLSGQWAKLHVVPKRTVVYFAHRVPLSKNQFLLYLV